VSLELRRIGSAVHFVPGVLFLVLSFQSLAKQQPIWKSIYDPTYAYLLGSAALIGGEPSNLYQHPGFSTQFIFAALLFVVHLLRSPLNNFSSSVVTNSEFYLNSLSAILAFLGALALIRLSKQLVLSVGTVGSFIFFLVFFYFRSTYLPWSVLAMPEATSLISCLFLLGELLRYQNHKDTTDISKRDILMISVLISTALMSKISCLPFLIPFLILLPKRIYIKTLLSTIFFSTIYAIPFVNQFKAIREWFVAIAVSTNRYDVQTSDKATQAKINFENMLNSIFGTNWQIFLLCVVFILLLSATVFKPFSQSTKNLLVASTTSLVLFILMGYKQSQGRDFGLIGVTIGILFSSFFAHKYFRRVYAQKILLLLASLSLFLMAPQLASDIGEVRSSLINAGRTNEDFSRLLEKLNSEPTLLTYGVPIPPEALSFGNQWSNNNFSKEVSSLNSNFLYFNIWNQITYRYNQAGETEGYDCETLTQNSLLTPTRILLSTFYTNELVRENSFNLFGSMQVNFTSVSSSDEGYNVFTVDQIICLK
jgi:hypothetical protein